MTENRQSRGRPSSIDLLPEDIRIRINEALRDKRLTQKEILDTFNKLLEDRKHDPISRSALNRYATVVEKMAGRVRDMREAASMVVGRVEDEKSDTGRALIEIVKNLAWEMTFKEDLDVDALNKLSLLIRRLESASNSSLDRELKVRDQARKLALEDAANAVENAAKQQGLDADQAQFWREQVLGVI
ncbi:MAG: hypothetical protein BA863_08955 [Desulfovibrio sp. S3730MH75]|nr:MAG: hypothetical protein BA863_08955 [Desulfovibrio sp. S3730MH75]